MNSKGLSSVNIILIVIVLGLIGGAYYLGTQKENIKVADLNNPQPTITPTITPTILPNPSQEPTQTPAWKTYTNNTFGYSLEYPADLIVTEVGTTSPDQIVYFNYTKGDYANKDTVTASFSSNVNIKKVKESGGGGDAGMAYVDAEKKIETIGGREVIKIDRKHTALDFETNKWVDTGETYITYLTLRTEYFILSGDIKNKETIDKMVDTFKLLY